MNSHICEYSHIIDEKRGIIMDTDKLISNSKSVLILLTEEHYKRRLLELMKYIEKKRKKICYVCLSKPYSYVINDLKEKDTNIDKFAFVDVLSSHYLKHEDRSNCVFVDSPDDLEGIKKAIFNVVTKKDCNIIVFDTISSLLSFNQQDKLLHFTNDLSLDLKECHKLFLFLKESSILYDEELLFVKDFELFIDETLDINHNFIM